MGLLIYLGYSHWLSSTERSSLLYGIQIEKLVETLSNGLDAVLSTYAENTFLFCIYLGLFASPLLLLQFSLRFKAFSKN
jgi:hypothetical protein